MTRRPPAMRVQLAAAMVALAVLSVAVAGLLIHRAADREVAEFGRRDLQQTANRIALSAAFAYTDAGGRTRPRLAETGAAATTGGPRLLLPDPPGRQPTAP